MSELASNLLLAGAMLGLGFGLDLTAIQLMGG
jgi:hypothetical protein